MVDACAALDLVKLKIARGPAFGTYLQGEQGDKLMDVLHSHNKRCTLIDRTDMLNRHVTGVHLDPIRALALLDFLAAAASM